MKLWIVILLSIALLTACSPQQTYQCPDGTIVDDVAKCQPSSPPVEPPQKPTEPTTPPVVPATPPANASPPEIQPLPQEVADLFAKANTKVTSVKYNYEGPPHPTEYYTVYLKGTKMRVDFPKGVDEIRQLNYDTVYIDLAENKGRAFCERDRNLCKGTEGIVITPSDYFFKTPFDWMKEIKTGTLGNSMQIDGRQALRLSDGNTTYWIDSYSGMPILIYIGEDTKSLAEDRIKYEYKGLAINSVADSDLMHQTGP